MVKDGPNKPCPCGSGEKYKKCHGAPNRSVISAAEIEAIQAHIRRMQDWEARFGRVAPPSSAQIGDQRVMVVNGKLTSFPARSTFHDFLVNYLVQCIGPSWFDEQANKPFAARHPIAQWQAKAEEFHLRHWKPGGPAYEVEMEGVVGHYLTLAHEVFALQHVGLLQGRLITRLLNAGNFQGARYELQVAAICLRAGFEVQLVDETDITSTHCEFSIKFPASGRQFSVEAKSRHRRGVLGRKGQSRPLTELRPQVGQHLEAALAKHADHFRIVFLDLNVPPFEGTWQDNGLADELIAQIQDLEAKQKGGVDLPPAVLVFTNRPAHYVEEAAKAPSSAFLLTGINIPEFRASQCGPAGPQEALRNKWPEVVALHQALKHQTDVPAAFNFDEPVA